MIYDEFYEYVSKCKSDYLYINVSFEIGFTDKQTNQETNLLNKVLSTNNRIIWDIS